MAGQLVVEGLARDFQAPLDLGHVSVAVGQGVLQDLSLEAGDALGQAEVGQGVGRACVRLEPQGETLGEMGQFADVARPVGFQKTGADGVGQGRMGA